MLVQENIQAGITLKPGYVLNPFLPLYGIDEPEDYLSSLIYHAAMEIDQVGGKADFAGDLDYWLTQVKLNGLSWARIGQIGHRLKLYKPWDKQYSSFRECCREGIGRSPSYINNCIRGFLVISNLIAKKITRLPQSLAVAIELSKLEVEHMCDFWRDVCDRYKDYEITVERVKHMLGDPMNEKPKIKRVQVEEDDWELLRETAANAGISPNQLLKQLIRGVEPALQEPKDEHSINYFPELEEEKQNLEDEEELDDNFWPKEEFIKTVKLLRERGIISEDAENLIFNGSPEELLESMKKSLKQLDENEKADQETASETDISTRGKGFGLPKQEKRKNPHKCESSEEILDPFKDRLKPSPEITDTLVDTLEDDDDDEYNLGLSLTEDDEDEQPEVDESQESREPEDQTVEQLLNCAEIAKKFGRIKDVFFSTVKNAWCAVMPTGHILPLEEWVEVF